MTTQVCDFVGYGETAGAPLCVCSLASAQAWVGTEQEQTRYWEVVEAMGQAPLFEWDAHHRFFNTETGNFALFRSADGTELVVVEVVSARENACRGKGSAFRLTPPRGRRCTCWGGPAFSTLP